MKLKELVKGKRETLGIGTRHVDIFQVFFFKSYTTRSALDGGTYVALDAPRVKSCFHVSSIYLF